MVDEDEISMDICSEFLLKEGNESKKEEKKLTVSIFCNTNTNLNNW